MKPGLFATAGELLWFTALWAAAVVWTAVLPMLGVLWLVGWWAS